jgi:hypothetical protein
VTARLGRRRVRRPPGLSTSPAIVSGLAAGNPHVIDASRTGSGGCLPALGGAILESNAGSVEEMHIRGWMTAVVAVGLVAACGGGPAGESTLTTAESTTTTPAATTTDEPTVTTAESATTTTSVEPAILHAGGVGAVDFGTPMDEALAVLAVTLGTPDEVERVELDEEMCCGRGEADSVGCIRLMGWATWQQLGLRLTFSDWGGDSPEPAPPRLDRWEAFAAGVATVEGIGVGSTVDDLRRAYPEVRFGIEQQMPALSVPSAFESRVPGVTPVVVQRFIEQILGYSARRCSMNGVTGLAERPTGPLDACDGSPVLPWSPCKPPPAPRSSESSAPF